MEFKGNVLATYLTYKEMYDSSEMNDVYDVVSCFLQCAVLSDRSMDYSVDELSFLLNELFGISVPDVVIRAAIKRIPGMRKKDNKYQPNYSDISEDPKFQRVQQHSEDSANQIINECIGYVKENYPSEYDEEQIQTSFLNFLIERPMSDSRLNKIISEFVVMRGSDKNFIEKLNEIRTGHILFMGLYYSDDLQQTVQIETPISIFLDTEILFHLAGYNGELFKRVAMDFLTVVDEINIQKKKIFLCYFKETKKEIDNFFFKAEKLKEQNKSPDPSMPAMRTILSGCRTPSDVVTKKSDFYLFLNRLGICEDTKPNYYSQQDEKYNLEDEEIITKYTNQESDKDQNEKRIRLISHINKLRKGELYTDFLKCRYILLTETNVTLSMSEESIAHLAKDRKQTYVQLAVDLYMITNTLWYRLNRKLKKNSYPISVNATVKAQMVLAALVNKDLSKRFQETMSDYRNGDLSDEQLVARIHGLSQETNLPELITSETLTETMRFLDNPDISIYEQELDYVKRQKEEKENDYVQLQKEMNKKQDEIENKQKQIDDLKKSVDTLSKKILLSELEKTVNEKRIICKEYYKVTKAGERFFWLLYTFILVVILFISVVVIAECGFGVIEIFITLLGAMYTLVTPIMAHAKKNRAQSIYNAIVSWYRKNRNCMYSTEAIDQIKSELLAKEEELRDLKETMVLG